MEIKIVNERLGLVCISGDIPNMSRSLLFVYYPKRNWIVFNAQHKDYSFFLSAIEQYLILTDISCKKFMDFVRKEFPETAEVFKRINSIRRIQRKLHQNIVL